MISQNAILTIGFLLFAVAVVWPPLILLVAYLVAKLLPYSYRRNDDAAERRLLFRDFSTDPQAPEAFRIIPNYVDYQQSYWINDRYVSQCEKTELIGNLALATKRLFLI